MMCFGVVKKGLLFKNQMRIKLNQALFFYIIFYGDS